MNQSPEDETVKNGLIGKFDGFYPDTGHTSQTPEDWRERFRAKFIMDMSWINTDPTGVKLESFIQSLLTETTKRVREEVAKLYCASGCSCCRDDKAWEEAGKELARLLNIPPYEDGSGFNFYKVRDEALNPNSSDETS